MLVGARRISFVTDASSTEVYLGLYVLLASGTVSLANEVNNSRCVCHNGGFLCPPR
jgi:hypothetical protein